MCNIVLQLIDQHWLYLWEWMNTSCLMCYRRVHRWFLTLQYCIFHACSASCVYYFPVCRLGLYYSGLFNIERECEVVSPCWLFWMLSKTSFQENFGNSEKDGWSFLYSSTCFSAMKLLCFTWILPALFSLLIFSLIYLFFTVPLTALTPGCRSVKIILTR